MSGKHFWRSRGEKCFALDIPLYRTSGASLRLFPGTTHGLRVVRQESMPNAQITPGSTYFRKRRFHAQKATRPHPTNLRVASYPGVSPGTDSLLPVF